MAQMGFSERIETARGRAEVRLTNHGAQIEGGGSASVKDAIIDESVHCRLSMSDNQVFREVYFMSLPRHAPSF
jgi:hypothetical protein